MSIEKILKNVYNFVDILQTACGSKVEIWNQKSLDNALQWAEYCEQIYRQAEGKPYQDELDVEIKKIGELPWAIGNRHISLYSLRNAVTVMRQALLSNVHLTPTNYEHLLLSYGDLQNTPHQLLQDVMCVREKNSWRDVAAACLSNTVDDFQTVLNKSEATASAQILLSYIEKHLTQKPQRQQKCEELLKKKLKNLLKEENGLKLICTASCVTGESQQYLLEWILQVPEIEQVFQLSPDLLAELSSLHFPFFRCYIQYLANAAKVNECIIDPRGSISYRVHGPYSYKDLQRHLEALLLCGGPVSTATISSLQAMYDRSQAGLWKELLDYSRLVLSQTRNNDESRRDKTEIS